MIDTIDVFCEFPNRYLYNVCYTGVDLLARTYGQALHKEGEKDFYFTTAFASRGILRIGFKTTKYRLVCHILLQPARCVHPGTNILLAQESDFGGVFKKMDAFFDSINKKCGNTVLPPLRAWHVKRIDYAVNLETDYATEYIRLFYAGAIPKGYKMPERYEHSFYLVSKGGNINFYDKMQQLKDVHRCTEEDIASELRDNPVGILRLEVQCREKHIQHLKERYRLPDTSLPYFWNADMAAHEICGKIAAVIGKKDFFSYEICERRLSLRYRKRTLALCSQIIRILRDNAEANLDDMQGRLPDAAKNQFSLLLHKIRKAGINPIPLEAARIGEGKMPLQTLSNPYREAARAIRFVAVEKMEGLC